MESAKFGMALRQGDALVIVDVQNDFVSGSLAVPHGDDVVAPLNRYIDAFVHARLPIVATRDWHPPDHQSFRERGGPWPRHCVAGTAGAAFVAELALPLTAWIVSKATDRAQEAYSGFAGTDLGPWLERAGVQRLFIGGLATDYCVLRTVLDARSRGYDTFVLADAIRAVDVKPGDGAAACEQMRQAGAAFVHFEDLVDEAGCVG